MILVWLCVCSERRGWGEATPALLSYPSVTVGISPLLPLASSESAQPWWRQKCSCYQHDTFKKQDDGDARRLDGVANTQCNIQMMYYGIVHLKRI